MILRGLRVSIWAYMCISMPSLLGQSLPGELAGTVRSGLVSAVPVADNKRAPVRNAILTLCSEQRIYRISGDKEGDFRFTGLKPGIYNLVVAATGYSPEIVDKFTITSGTRKERVNAILHSRPGTSACFVSSEGQSSPSNYEVEYGPLETGLTSAQIEGTVTYDIRNKRDENAERVLKNARVELFRAGDPTSLQSVEVDSKGRFTFNVKPGTYELSITHQGFYPVKVPDFLVPEENVTVVRVRTLDTRWVVVGD